MQTPIALALVALGLAACAAASRRRSIPPSPDQPVTVADQQQNPLGLLMDKNFASWSKWSKCRPNCTQQRVRQCRAPAACHMVSVKERRLCRPARARRRGCSKARRKWHGAATAAPTNARPPVGVASRLAPHSVKLTFEDTLFNFYFYPWQPWSSCNQQTCSQSRFRPCRFSAASCRNFLITEQKQCFTGLCRTTDPLQSARRNKTRLTKDDFRERLKDCGQTQLNASSVRLRIINGSPARRGQWPWQVAIMTAHRGRGQQQYCGGTLISPQWVLTTAHCLYRNGRMRENIIVRVAEHDLNRNEGSEMDIDIEHRIVHPHFTSIADWIANDIALIKLKHAVTLGPYVHYICLPFDTAPLAHHRMCHVTGWGKASTTDRRGSPVLLEAAMPIVSRHVCQRSFLFHVRDEQLCAGYWTGLLDSCAGDSGGPLQCQHGDRWFIHGITSFGEGCGLQNKYGIYTDVSKFLDWILDQVSNSSYYAH